MLSIQSLENLVQELSKLPGVGQKSAQRLAYHILKAPKAYAYKLAEVLVEVKNQIKECTECFNFTEHNICVYCQDLRRSDDILCVVEDPMHIARIEASGVYTGRYHVLHGVISPLEGISASDLKVNELVTRAQNVKELIFALDTSLEGDTTVLYLTKVLQRPGLKLSKLAQGVPMGSNLDYVDDRTMGRAMQNRINLLGL